MTLQEMKARKKELGYSNQTIAERSGVPLSTVQKIFSGKTTSPREDTIAALEGLLKPVFPYGSPADPNSLHQADSSAGIYKKSAGPANTGDVRERTALYAPNTLHTVEEYLTLPAHIRLELIDGIFYDMAALDTTHQLITAFFHRKLLDHTLANGGSCVPFLAPVDVQLDSDNRTMVQPDVFLICDKSKNKGTHILGAPDLVIEVLSPATRRKDMQIKLYKYGNAGVREYWIVDPDKKVLIQYDLEHSDPPRVFDFQASVPVLIWNGACKVDLKELVTMLELLA